MSINSSYWKDLKNTAKQGFDGGLKILSIQLNLMKSTHIVSLGVDLSYWKLICTAFRKYSASGHSGWVKNVDSTWFNWINRNRIAQCRFVMPEVDLLETWKMWHIWALRVSWKCCRFNSIRLNRGGWFVLKLVCLNILKHRVTSTRIVLQVVESMWLCGCRHVSVRVIFTCYKIIASYVQVTFMFVFIDLKSMNYWYVIVTRIL